MGTAAWHKSSDTVAQVIVAGVMASKGYKQMEIASTLGVSQPEVSVCVQRFKEIGGLAHLEDLLTLAVGTVAEKVAMAEKYRDSRHPASPFLTQLMALGELERGKDDALRGRKNGS